MQTREGDTLILRLDFSGETPIYMQIRNQIIIGIADGRLKAGEKLPTIRTLADESGVNMMTVSKAYQLLKQEGYIAADRRSGAIVIGSTEKSGVLSAKAESGLKLIISEAKIGGISKEEFLRVCAELFDNLEV
jgi:GntR family transcriptional regulator